MFRGVNCAEVLETARQRIAGSPLPVTLRDERRTATTIHAITYDFDREFRLDLLSGVLAGLIFGIPSEQERVEVLECTFALIRDGVRETGEGHVDCQPMRKNGGVNDVEYCGGDIIQNDFETTDRAFDRALRRRAGDCLQITTGDLNATYSLVRQLMTGVDLVVLVCVIVEAIVEEYGGQPPDEVLNGLQDLIRNTIAAIDWMSASDGLMH